jgi:signal transduction histidine kinase
MALGRVERQAFRICVIYATVSVVWITASDRVLYALVKDPNLVSWIAVAKGWAFVGITCTILYFLVRNLMREQYMAQEQAWLSQKNEALGRMATGVAHDFNNILQVVSVASQMGAELPSAHPDTVRLFAQMAEASTRGRDLVRHLMAFARQAPSQPRLVDLEEELKAMVAMLASVVRPPVVLRLDIEPGSGKAMLDPVQLQQVLMNLVVNAVDAMPKGGNLVLGLRRRGSQVELQVQDSGIGIKEEDLPHIFEPFFTTKAGKGNGLGLATVHGIVRQWNGAIRVDTGLGLGSTFVVSIPSPKAAA